MTLHAHFLPTLRCLAVAVIVSWGSSLLSRGDTATSQKGVVATVHPLASQAALDAFKRGGNAIDAAVAAALTLGVVDGHNSGIGGGCMMTIRLANGRLVCIDGRELAPVVSTRDMYLRNGKADGRLSQFGPLAIATPGALLAYQHALSKYGRLRLGDLLLPAAKVANDGFKIDATYASRISSSSDELRAYLPQNGIFFRPDGEPKQAGDLLRQPDLSKSYRAIAAQGTRWFYNGAFTGLAGDWIVARGGILNAIDFAAYQTREREPVATTYRGYTIVSFPPPSSGGVHLVEILNVLENFDLKLMGANSADTIHVVAEAMKLAFADRAQWLGDPDFVRVPRGLASKPYAAQLAKLILPQRVIPVPGGGKPPGGDTDYFRQHTTHFSTADASGNWVACTATLNTSFGSKVMVPGTGILLNNQMDDFSIQPGAPNYFGLIGSEANSIAPRKRPLSSMSPTIVLKNGRPVMALGAAGGPTIISQALLTIINVVDFGLDVETALLQPRFHHQWRPDELQIESKIPEQVITELTRRGHRVKPVQSLGATQVVALGTDGKGLMGATDPRGEGKAGGL